MQRLILLLLLLFSGNLFSQSLSGTITDAKTGEAMIGATIIVKGTTIGTTTDLDGKFRLAISQPLPFTVIISIVGYQKQELEVTQFEKPLTVKLRSSEVELKNVEVVG
ncbi:MAG: carboxypeptidase-like regulatory domain-containing protein, partial [Bacteroidota bacterium]